MGWFDKIHTATGRSVGNLISDPLDLKDFASHKRALTIKNLSDPMSVGIAAPSKTLNVTGGIAALIAGGMAAGAGGGAAAGEGAGSAEGAAGMGAGLGFDASAGGGAEAVGGVGGVGAGDAGGAESGALGSSSEPWWKKLMQQGMGGEDNANNSNAYQQLKLARQIRSLQDPNYANYGVTNANNPNGY